LFGLNLVDGPTRCSHLIAFHLSTEVDCVLHMVAILKGGLPYQYVKITIKIAQIMHIAHS
jgi:hypothetical protein